MDILLIKRTQQCANQRTRLLIKNVDGNKVYKGRLISLTTFSCSVFLLLTLLVELLCYVHLGNAGNEQQVKPSADAVTNPLLNADISGNPTDDVTVTSFSPSLAGEAESSGLVEGLVTAAADGVECGTMKDMDEQTSTAMMMNAVGRGPSLDRETSADYTVCRHTEINPL